MKAHRLISIGMGTVMALWATVRTGGAEVGQPVPVAEDLPMIRHSVTVPASREAVWAAWTTSEGLEGFLASRARVELRLGGAFEVDLQPERPSRQRGSEGCVVLSFIEGEMLSFTWSAPPDYPAMRDRRTIVVVSLEDGPGPDETKVELTHTGWPDPGSLGGDAAEVAQVHEHWSAFWPKALGRLEGRFREGVIVTGGEGDASSGSTPQRWYAMYIHPARADFFEGPTEEENRIIGRHALYVRHLIGSGQLFFAGPSFEPTQYPEGEQTVAFTEMQPPGVIIFRAADDEEARRILSNDPAVSAGVFKGRVNPINMSFVGWHGYRR